MSTQLLDEIETVIDARVRPALRAHGGEIRVDTLKDDGVLCVRLLGACVGCPAADLSMRSIVREELLSVEGLTDVVLVGSVSDELLAQAHWLLSRERGGIPLKLIG